MKYRHLKKVITTAMALALFGTMLPQMAYAGEQADPVELVLWHPASLVYGSNEERPEDSFVGKQIAAYEESHNVKVTIVSQPQDNFDNLFKAANMAQNGPDVVMLWAGSMTTNYAPSLVELNDALTEEELGARTGWELACEDYTCDPSSKSIYGIPFTGNTYGIYYNKELFDAAGITEDNLPETWEDFMEACQKLKNSGTTPLIVGAKDGYVAQWGIGCIVASQLGNDSSLFTSGNPLTGTLFEEAAGKWTSLYEQGYINENALSYDTGSAISEFLNEKGAMFLSGNWVGNDILDGLGEKAGFMKWPMTESEGENREYTYGGAANNLCVLNYSRHQEEAIDLIKYMTSKEFLSGYFQATGELPMAAGIGESDLEGLNEFQIKNYEILSSGNCAILVDLMPLNAFNTLVRNGSLLTMGKIAPADFTGQIDQEINEG